MSCLDSARPIFTVFQQSDGSLEGNKSNDSQYFGTDVDGKVIYMPFRSSTVTPGPPTSLHIRTATTTKVVSPTNRFATRSSTKNLSILRRPNPRLFFGLIIMSSFLTQIQALSTQIWGGLSSSFMIGSVMIYPLIWSLLSVGVQGQCYALFTYINVRITQD